MNSSNFSNVLVTGALGHIGSSLIRRLCDDPKLEKIFLLDNLSTSRYSSLFDLKSNSYLKFIKGDARLNLEQVIESEIDCVIHLAALTDPSFSAKDPENFISHNLDSTKSVLDFCKVKSARYIGISSTSIYGTSGNELTEEEIFDNGIKQSPYAKSKLMEENLINTYINSSKLDATILRFGTIFGTSIGMRFHTAVNKFCWDACMESSISVWKTAINQYRPYLDLNDAVNSILFAMNNVNCVNQTFNVVTSHNTVNEILKIIQKHRPLIKISLVDSPIMNNLSYTLSTKKIQDIGFDYCGSLEDSIAATLSLFKSFS